MNREESPGVLPVFPAIPSLRNVLSMIRLSLKY
jgi:hypothetical protein